ncbi:MAG: hypothetical protein BIFFINMI_03736 [Phycisphaerae bacterium]|nr:hypothetical protein [Phycisphaerae bacterium]
MLIREAAVAGTFYKAQARGCRIEVEELFGAAVRMLASLPPLPPRVVGGIVPHAGYLFSGAVAALTLEAIARSRDDAGPATFVLLGAMHRPTGHDGLVFDRGQWETPLGPVAVNERLAGRLLDSTNALKADLDAHEQEHSIEVQLPLIRHRFPAAEIVPILVPPAPEAPRIGLAIGRALKTYDADAVVIGSTDLTHYGPRYGFTPAGMGQRGLDWAKGTNDAGIIDAVRRLAADEVVAEAESHCSACGGGAVAATLASAKALGATAGVILRHTTSHEVAAHLFHDPPSDAVGYLSAILA